MMAAKAATTTIPIVFVTAGNPIAVGLVASLNRPGGNITGVTSMGVELGPKQLEVLRELRNRAFGFDGTADGVPELRHDFKAPG